MGCGLESWGLTCQGQGPHARPPTEPVGVGAGVPIQAAVPTHQKPHTFFPKWL